jgi:hypothetical protein
MNEPRNCLESALPCWRQTVSRRYEQQAGALEETASAVGDIDSSASKIADIIGVIDGIAVQTNILALDAAVALPVLPREGAAAARRTTPPATRPPASPRRLAPRLNGKRLTAS